MKGLRGLNVALLEAELNVSDEALTSLFSNNSVNEQRL